MGRDLLYKPQIPQQLPDESTEEAGKAKKKSGAKGARDLGQVGETVQVKLPAGSRGPRAGAPAHKAAYFNKDISGVKDPNLAQSNMKALRGSDGATDLRKVVLPPAAGIENPDPADLRAASDLMGLDGGMEMNLETLLGRQGAWARQKGVTVEMLEERMRQMEEMVESRKAALLRMLDAERGSPSVTVEQAVTAKGNALEEADDVAEQGKELVERTAEQAAGMHYRLAKMLGIKRGG